MGAWLAPVLGAVGGGLLGGFGADSGSSPTKSWTEPPDWLGGKGALQEGSGWLKDAYDPGNFNYQGPSQGLQSYVNQYTAGGPGGAAGGGGGGGGGAQPWQNLLAGGGGGGGGGGTNYASILGIGGGGGGGGAGWKNWGEHAAGLTPAYTDFQESLIGTGRDQFMDIAGNQYLQAAKEATGQQLAEQYERALGQSAGTFSDATMGMSGANAMFRQQGLDDYTQNLANTYAGLDYNQYNQNLQAQLAAAGQYEGTRQNLISGLASTYGSDQARAAAIRSAQLSSIASMYGSDAAAAASRYGSRLGAASSMYGANQAASAARLGHRLDYQLGSDTLGYNMLQGMDNAQMMYDKFLQDSASGYWNDLNRGMQGWGTQYNQGQQLNPWEQALGGAWGGFTGGGGLDWLGGLVGD